MKKWFKSILACLTAVSLAACGSASTSASSSAEASSASNVKDGTYTASAEGFGGQDVTVTIGRLVSEGGGYAGSGDHRWSDLGHRCCQRRYDDAQWCK